MKRLFFIILTAISVISTAQDSVMSDFINKYRHFNGKKPFVLSEKLNLIANNQSSIILKEDSLSHSHLVSEVATRGISLPISNQAKTSFSVFLKKIFNIDYVEPSNDIEVITMVKLYSLYLFDQSPKHKKIILSDNTYFGYKIITNNITKVKFGSKINYYKVNFVTVIDFN